MVIKLNNLTDGYEQARTNYVNVVKNENSTPEQVEEAWSNMQEELVNSLTKKITNEVNRNGYQSSLINKNMLNGEERQFFNSLTTEVGFATETLLPEKTVNRIFEDLTTDHPLLAALNIQTTGLKTRYITSDTSGTAVWGKIFGEIKGQLDVLFSSEDITQGKLTAFVVVPKDFKDYGPEWTELFVRTQIVETFSLALEQGYLLGAGPELDEPVGLIKDLASPVSPTTGYANKTAIGELTFADAATTVTELAKVYKRLAVKENGKFMKIKGKVYMIANPVDAIELESRFTVLTANGEFVSAVPFGLKIIESEFMMQGEVLFFVEGRYDASIGGNLGVKEYKETLALEDCNLYIAKQFAFGKARDNKAAILYTLSAGE